MNVSELEELVATIRQYIQKARNCNDIFEYCRLCDELTLAEAALDSCDGARANLAGLFSFTKGSPALQPLSSN